jgi:hypothetical protein
VGHRFEKRPNGFSSPAVLRPPARAHSLVCGPRFRPKRTRNAVALPQSRHGEVNLAARQVIE